MFSIAIRHLDLFLRISGIFFFFLLRRPTHSYTWKSVGHFWNIYQSDTKFSAWIPTTLKIDSYLCPRRESNMQSHLARGRNPTSYFSRPLG